ncbi:TPA: hypothetical protein ACQQIU_006166 [Pseudomonas aeruginosa]
MSSTQHQLIEQCATRLRGIVEALDNIHDTSPQRWSTDLDDVHSSAESLLALIKDQAPPSEDQLTAAGLSYPLAKEDAVKLWYSGFRSEVITVLEAWEAIGHDTGINPDKEELLESLRNMAAICNAHGNDMPAQSAIDQRQVIADAITGALAFGAQASQPPTADHWLRPFYDIGRAEGQRTQELAMLVRMLASSLKRHAPESNLVARATNYLAAKGLAGTPLRDSPALVEQAGGDERKLSDLGNELHNLSCSIVHENEEWAEQIGGIARELWNWPQARATLAQPEGAPVIGCLCGMPMTEGHHSPDGCCNLEEFAPSPAQSQAEGFTHFPEPLESVQQMDAMLKAEAERPEVVAWRYGFSGEIVSDKACLDEWKSGGEYQSLMTVAQHERIAASHWERAMDLMGEHVARISEKFKAERDAALARVAEGWKLVPSDKGCVTSSMKAECIGEFSFYIRAACAECLDVGTDSDCHVCGGDIEYDQKIDVPWDTCKEIYKAMLAAAPGKEVPQAWLDVQAERKRQVEVEGWTPEHDDAHNHGQMARAAACYALAGSSAPNDGTAALLVSLAWPWDEQWWKPSTARRDMVKACALGLAEIERLDRAAPAEGGDA